MTGEETKTRPMDPGNEDTHAALHALSTSLPETCGVMCLAAGIDPDPSNVATILANALAIAILKGVEPENRDDALEAVLGVVRRVVEINADAADAQAAKAAGSMQ